MSNEIEKDYDTYCQEIEEKVTQAIKLLNEAKEAAAKGGIHLKGHDEWFDLQAIVGDFVRTPEKQRAWDASSWCAEGEGWNDSGCSY